MKLSLIHLQLCSNLIIFQCEYKPNREVGARHAGWARGLYICKCRPGYYSINHPEGFNGSLVEGL